MPETPALDPIGPVEFIVLAFPGNRFTGEITPALDELLAAEFVRIIDLAVVAKDHDGTVSILEMQELSPDVARALETLTGSVSGLLSEGDLDAVAEELAPGNTAAALLFEHVWATRFAEAVRAAHGQLLLAERIPHSIVTEVRAGLLAAADTL